MQLDGIHIALRQRTPWEAADLGFALVRRHGAAAPATPQPAGSIHEEASCSLTV